MHYVYVHPKADEWPAQFAARNQKSNEETKNQQELIRRWKSERELFYDNIVHVEASAYDNWTDFLISTIIAIYARPNLCT